VKIPVLKILSIYNADISGNRTLTLRHYQHNKQYLGSSAQNVLAHIHRLWDFDIKLESADPKERYSCGNYVIEYLNLSVFRTAGNRSL